MSSQPSDQELGDALLDSVQNGSFPQSEAVSSALVEPGTLPQLRRTLRKAREETRSHISRASRSTSSDVDGYLNKVRELQADIDRSQETAGNISHEGTASKQKTANVQDAAAKVGLLHSEIAYTDTLDEIIDQLKDINDLLASAADAAVNNHVLHALDRLEDAESAFEKLVRFEEVRVVGLLRSKSHQLKAAVVENLQAAWNGLIVANGGVQKITLKEEVGSPNVISINTVVQSLTKLDLLETYVSRLARDIDLIVVQPRLIVGPDQTVSALTISGSELKILGQVSDMSVKAAIQDIQCIVEYLNTRLPPEIVVPLSETLVPTIATRLITNWLLPAVPLSSKGVAKFEESLKLVAELLEYFEHRGWKGQHRLKEWLEKSPSIWLARQQQDAATGTQRTLERRTEERKTVERVETQVVKDEPRDDEGWGAEWGEEKDGSGDEEEEGLNAWGVDEEDPSPVGSDDPKREAPTGDDSDDWGAWGDDDDDDPSPNSTSSVPQPAPPSNQHSTSQVPTSPKPSGQMEVTLRETYTVTGIPDALIETILDMVNSVTALTTPPIVCPTITAAAPGLLAIPTFLLSLYRATAPLYYERHIAENMLVYNDCQRLSEQMGPLLTSALSPDVPEYENFQRKIEEGKAKIEAYGRRAYGREMEAQRQILRDHLDAAQGFSNCTKDPFAAECDNAVAMTIDRINDVKNIWKPVLSHSALLQSLGNLVSTAITKFVADIEDMDTISEAESQKLRGYCVSLSSLSALFLQDEDDGTQRDMTPACVPGWLRFQYLSEVLDSRLTDIAFLWRESELKLEIGVDEMTDLIKALFADSEQRRKTIAEIKRTAIA